MTYKYLCSTVNMYMNKWVSKLSRLPPNKVVYDRTRQFEKLKETITLIYITVQYTMLKGFVEETSNV